MKTLFVSFILFVSSCLSCAFLVPGIKNKDPAKQSYSSVGRLSVITKDKKGGIFATGFAISDSKIITAGHFCIDWLEGNVKGIFPDEIDITIIHGNSLLELSQVLEVELIEEKMDVCILKGNPGLEPVVFADYSKTKVGDKVYNIGSSLSLFPQYSEGRINVPKFDIGDNRGLLYMSLDISPGSSGSPCFNDRGELVGMVIASVIPNVFLIARSPFALAQRSDVIQKFAKMVEEE